MTNRTVVDRLRAEYFERLPEIRSLAEQLDTEVRHCLSPLKRKLRKHQRLEIVSRVKECESAIGSVRKKQEGRIFNERRPKIYSICQLKDLAGVRVLAFPGNLEKEADERLRAHFPKWKPDHIFYREKESRPLARKYDGILKGYKIRAEYQVLPMLVGLFWNVEHAVIYKPDPVLQGIAQSPMMGESSDLVLSALVHFSSQFENLIKEAKRK